ncbi:DUF1553 domain-containing protein [Novipirellula sp. SH528]|uniref:DUF1553 domain-containing protein n=1 Tax=Novipirellula sp. SH528 TaxID=3454466 RepID=UPI003F9EE313
MTSSATSVMVPKVIRGTLPSALAMRSPLATASILPTPSNFKFRWLVAFVICFAVSDSFAANTLTIDNSDADRLLVGRDARIQLIVSRHFGDSSLTAIEDATSKVTYVVEPSGIASVDPGGLVIPIADGHATIKAEGAEGEMATAIIKVSGMNEDQPVSFPGQIVPIFTKLGCNGGGCHGKAAGQNGFKLSLLGFEPREDYGHLVEESRGRRISTAFPDRSLLLMKSINASPHGGGQRLEADSHEYRLMRRWIAQGTKYGDGNEPKVTSIEVLPSHRRLLPRTSQQLSVVANYSDGSREDVTRAVVYATNDTEMADVDAKGRVTLNSLVGDVAVMARYQGNVTVFRADIPQQLETSPESLTPEPANLVDTHVFAKLQSLGIPASPMCDDATFLRRATLDITGRLPTLAETRTFLEDSSAEKRPTLVDGLLRSSDHANYFAGKWNTILRNKRQRSELQFATVAFYQWIRDSIAENKPYDEFVREIITASGSVANHPPVAWYQQVADTNSRVEDAAQLFLGQRVACARCHHHPYEKWSQADYAKLSAFFVTVSKKGGGEPLEPDFFARVGAATSPHPKNGQALPAAGLDAEPAAIAASEDARFVLADWMTDPSNPFFAKSLVNRYWKHFMGRGLIEPEDDMRITNPPSNPELLDALAAEFVESGYDLRSLVRSIVLSKTYGFSSEPVPGNLGDRRSYSRYYPKRMQAEVLLDAVDDVTGNKTTFAGMPAGTRAVELPDTQFTSYFLSVFGMPAGDTACECERSQEANLAQSLHLINSDEMQGKLAADAALAARLAADTQTDDHRKLSELYLTAFSRPATSTELETMLRYLDQKENRREAYEDILWSLVNSKEFLFNH